MYKPEKELFYVQDTRSYVGNSVLWWRIEGKGYTTNLNEAMIVEVDWHGRDTDKLIPKIWVDQNATKQLDSQKLTKIIKS